ncbi:MAG: hypothetical protein DWQ04_31825 [Chloroflexi bacterium]|nr:MAG: hypothetical protein DWQ04_31825 [Chloroflexota bacterium]
MLKKSLFTINDFVQNQSGSKLAKMVGLGAKILQNEYWQLFFITTIATVLRLFRLGEWSFWVDELFTLENAQNLLINLSDNPRLFVTEHPITASLINVAISVFGVSEWSARLAPVLIGVLSVPIMFVFVRRLFNTSTGLITAILLAMSPWHVIWSQNVRFYVTLLLFFNLALFFFYWGIEENKVQYLLLSMLFLGFATSERLLALYFVPIIICYLILLQTNWFGKPDGLNWRNITIIFFPGIVFGIVFAWNFIQDPSEWSQIYFVYSETSPAVILKQFIQGVDVFLLILGSMGAVFLISKRRRIVVLLTLAAILPVVITMGASAVQYAHSRYTFVSLISWIVLASVAATTLFKYVSVEGRWLMIGLLAIVLFFVPLQENYEYYTQLLGDRPDMKSAFALVKNVSETDDIVVSNDSIVGNYYLKRNNVINMNTWDDHLKPEALAESTVDVWYVIGRDSRMNPNFLQWVEENATLYNADYNLMRIYVYRAD